MCLFACAGNEHQANDDLIGHDDITSNNKRWVPRQLSAALVKGLRWGSAVVPQEVTDANGYAEAIASGSASNMHISVVGQCVC